MLPHFYYSLFKKHFFLKWKCWWGGSGGVYLFGSSPPIIFTILITGLFFWKTHLKIAGSHIQMVFKKCTNCHTILCSRKKIYRMGDKFVLRDGLDDSSIPPLDLFAGVSMLLLAWQINNMVYSSLFFFLNHTVWFLKKLTCISSNNMWKSYKSVFNMYIHQH